MIKVYQLKAPQRDLTPAESKSVMTLLMLNPTPKLVSSIWHDMYPGLEYKLVATVDTNDLERAFYLTNSIDDYWGNNEGVEQVNTNHRSTSVGDIMEHNGKWSIVSSFGFTEFTLRDNHAIRV